MTFHRTGSRYNSCALALPIENAISLIMNLVAFNRLAIEKSDFESDEQNDV